MSSAYIAMKLLNQFKLRHTLAELRVDWLMANQYNNIDMHTWM